MTRGERAQAWAASTRGAVDRRDPDVSEALAMARKVYDAVPEHGNAAIEDVIAGALLEFVRERAALARTEAFAEANAALRGAIDAAGRELSRMRDVAKVGP